MNNGLEQLLNEWLDTLGTEKHWWDGTHCSEHTMAQRFVGQFLKWLEDQEVQEGENGDE